VLKIKLPGKGSGELLYEKDKNDHKLVIIDNALRILFELGLSDDNHP
jgi:hypothetical protein